MFFPDRADDDEELLEVVGNHLIKLGSNTGFRSPPKGRRFSGSKGRVGFASLLDVGPQAKGPKDLNRTPPENLRGASADLMAGAAEG